jgi:hypothetical protein
MRKDALRSMLMELLLGGSEAQSTGFPRLGNAHAGFRPKESTSSNVNNFTLRAGTLWRNGSRYLLDSDTEYTAQVDEDGAALTTLTTPSGDRTDLVYLDVSTQEIDSTEDTDIMYGSLGIETSVRSKLQALVRVEEGVDADTPALPTAPSGRTYFELAIIRRTASASITATMITQTASTIYVTGDLVGLDTNSGADQSNGLKTLKEAVKRVPRILNEDWRIEVLHNGGTGASGSWEEPILLSGIQAMPRFERSAETQSDTVRTHDGRPRSTYELIIEPRAYDQQPLLNLMYTDGYESAIYNCDSVTLRGIVFTAPRYGLVCENVRDLHMVGCAGMNCGLDGILMNGVSGMGWNMGALGNLQHGYNLTATSFVFYEDISINTNAAAGIYVNRASSVSVGLDDPYNVTHATTILNLYSIHSNGTAIRVYHGSQAIVGQQDGSRALQIYNGQVGVSVRRGSYARIVNTEFGRVSASGDVPSTVSVVCSHGSYTEMVDVQIDGESSGGSPVSGASGAWAVDSGALEMDNVIINNIDDNAVRVRVGSYARLNSSLSSTASTRQCVFGFSGGQGSTTPRIAITTNSYLFCGGNYKNDPVATGVMTILSDGNAVAPAAIDVQIQSHVRVFSNSRLQVIGFTSDDIVADVVMCSSFSGNQATDTESGVYVDAYPGSAADKFANYSTEGTIRGNNGAGGHGYEVSGQQSDPQQCVVSDGTNGGTV